MSLKEKLLSGIKKILQLEQPDIIKILLLSKYLPNVKHPTFIQITSKIL